MDQGGTGTRAPEGAVSVVAIEDHPVCARGLRATMSEAHERVRLVDVVDTVVELNGSAGAQVALLEVELRDGSRPTDNVRRLVEAGLTVLVYTNCDDAYVLAEALRAGAAGIVLKHQSEDDLIQAIHLACRGVTYLPDEVAQRIADGEALRPRLSAREVEVLNLLYQGLITKQAARRLQVSESTVKEHLKRIRQKYAALERPVSTRVQLLQVAHRDGFITPDGAREEE